MIPCFLGLSKGVTNFEGRLNEVDCSQFYGQLGCTAMRLLQRGPFGICVPCLVFYFSLLVHCFIFLFFFFFF